MEVLDNKWALVTGASERKANVVLVACRTEPMERLAEELRQRHSVQVVVEGMDL